MTGNMRRELPRQLVHMAGVVMAPLALFAGRWTAIALCFAAVAFFLVYPRIVKKSAPVWKGVHDAINGLERDGIRVPYAGAVWFYLGSGLVLLLFETRVAAVAITVLALGDGVSTIAGTAWGRHKLPFNRNKSLEGFLGFLLASLGGSLLLTAPAYAVAASVVGAVVESLPAKMDDNVTVPLAVALALSALNFV